MCETVIPFPKCKEDIIALPEYSYPIEKYDYLIKWRNRKGRIFFLKVEKSTSLLAVSNVRIKIYYMQELAETNFMLKSNTKIEMRRVVELLLTDVKKENKDCIKCKFHTICKAQKLLCDNKTNTGVFSALIDLPWSKEK